MIIILIFCTSILASFAAILIVYKRCQNTRVNRNIDITGKKIVIIGGSKGIGKQLAIQLVSSGAIVTIVARNEADLIKTVEEIKSKSKISESIQSIDYQVIDVCSSEENIAKQIDKIFDKVHHIDILINCAGYSVAKPFYHTDVTEFENLMNTNFMGTVKIIKNVLPDMQKRNFGQIVLISSVAGQIGLYGYSAYSSSKFALRGLAESLAMELTHLNIGLTLVFPPDTDTEGFAFENIGKPEITKIISASGGLYNPSFVAQKIIEGIQRRSYSISFGLEGKLMEILTLGSSPVTNLFKEVAHFFVAGFSRMVLLVYLSKYYKIVKEHRI